MSDPFASRSQSLTRRIALAMGILGTLALFTRLATAELASQTLLIGIGVITIYFTLYLLPKHSRINQFTVCLFTITNFIGLFTLVYFSSGLNSPIAMLIPIICIMGFLTLNNRSSAILCILTAIGVIGFAYLELNGHPFPENPLSAEGIVFMRAVWLIFASVAAALLVYLFRKQNRLLESQLYETSVTDHLTSLYNRRYFDRFIAEEYSRNKRNQTWLAVVLIDIDYFKSYNDSYGHQAGDICLVEIAKLLKENFKRSVDRIVRYGGEEFIVVLPETNLETAYELAEIFRQQVRQLNILHSASNHKTITVSIGVHVAHGSDKHELKTLIQGADQAMYQSKQQGRNQVSVYTDPSKELADNK